MAGTPSVAPLRPWKCCHPVLNGAGSLFSVVAVWMMVMMAAPGGEVQAATSTTPVAGIETGIKSLSQISNAGRRTTSARGLSSAGMDHGGVQFKHGTVRLDPTYTPVLPGGQGHVLVQFTGPLSPAQQQTLRERGIELVEYIPQDTWKVRLTADTLTALRALDFVVALGNLYPVDKVPPAVLTGDFNPRSLNADGSLTLEVSFQPAVTYDRALQLLAGLDATAEQPALLSGNRLTVRLPQNRVLALLALDDVAWVEDREAPKTGSNVGAAALSHINSLWQPPLQLSGAGVVAGMWDEGLVDVSHPDLAGHVVQGESGHVVGHATHVAGTFAGSGAGNPAARGMAPGVSLRSYDFYGDPVGEQIAVRNATGMALTNNSWGYLAGWQSNYYGDGYWTWFGGSANRTDPELGSYSSLTRDWDAMIYATGLVVVKSAGNDRSDSGASGQAHHHYGDGSALFYDAHDADGDYRSVGQIATAKNVITVGAVDAAGAMTAYSAWGPTSDDRLKPDLVAKGQDVFSTYSNGSYTSMSGTSMAAPVVSGAVALLVERYRTVTAGMTPTPQLIRALLANTAVDLGNPGPDYAYGWGLLDARAAAAVIDADDGSGRRMVADSVATGNVRRYGIDIAGAAAPLKITLAWTDPAGAAGAATALVNDLDLKLIGPDGTVYYPYSLAGMSNPAALATTHGPNTVDNTEQVLVPVPNAGHWQIEVRGSRVQGNQAFALVSNRDMPVDAVSPGGAYVVVNAGAHFALSYDVQLFLAGYDNLGVTGYYFSENPQTPALGQFTRIATVPRFSLTVPYRFSAGEGAKTVYLWLRDAAGNISEVAKAVATVDTLPPAAPQLTVKPGSLPGRPQWQWSSPDGAVTFRYKLNDARLEVGAVETQAFSYTPGAPLSAGTAVLYVQARDEAGLWSAMSRATIVISAEDAAAVQGGVSAFPPSVQAVTPVNSPFPRWTWNSLQGGGGIFRVRLDQPDLSAQPETTAVAFVPQTPLADGIHTLYVQDRGSDGRWTAVVGFSVMIDTAAPVTSAEVSPAAGVGRSITLQCKDVGGAGCAATYYTLDGSEPTTQSARYNGPIVVNASATLRFLSFDQAGNEEAVQVESYQIADAAAAVGGGGGGAFGAETLLLGGLLAAVGFRRRAGDMTVLFAAGTDDVDAQPRFTPHLQHGFEIGALRKIARLARRDMGLHGDVALIDGLAMPIDAILDRDAQVDLLQGELSRTIAQPAGHVTGAAT